MTDSFRVVASEQLFHSFVFDVERRTVEHAGATFEREFAAHQGAVAILAISDADEVGFLRQYRAAFDRFILEVPAGTLDVEGEEPRDAAVRELREELGMEASSWRELGRFTVSPGWTDQVMHIFEARGLRDVGRRPEGPEETSSTVEWIAVGDIKETLLREPTVDYTVAVALHRVFGSFFDVE